MQKTGQSKTFGGTNLYSFEVDKEMCQKKKIHQKCTKNEYVSIFREFFVYSDTICVLKSVVSEVEIENTVSTENSSF